ncbi:hypothetical protein [Microbacterium gorillae]|uniref:hypothetical protein n=1 Tax=Microbacterium gorillae TaxID=1231063 RepID=UPI003D97982F
MSSDTPSSEPRPQWVFAPKPKRHPGRVVLIVVLIALVVAIALTTVIVLMPRGGTPGSAATSITASPTTSTSASATRTPSPSTSATPTTSPTATATPEPTPTEELPPVEPQEPEPLPTDAVTAPPVVVPDTGAFATAISPRVSDADTGLGMLASQTPDAAFDIVRTLEQDAMILADENPPDSIASSWRPTVQTYLSALGTLRTAIGDGTDTAAPLSDVRSALQAVKDLAGL